jgi:hypothetical protein
MAKPLKLSNKVPMATMAKPPAVAGNEKPEPKTIMNFRLQKEIQIGETEDFKPFAKEIDYLIEFFRSFSELVFYNGRIIAFISGNHCYTLDTTLIDSSTQTLRSIKLCCSIGSFSDANILIRKLRDDLVQYVYILNMIILQKPFYEKDLRGLTTDSPENFAGSILKLRLNNNSADDEKAVSAWFSNTVSDLPRPIKRKLEFENYMTVLKQNHKITQVLNEYNLQEYWEFLRKKLNDYVHNNGKQFSVQNNLKATHKSLGTHLKNISIRASYISSFFIVALLMVESSLISSTDYIDHVDCGLEPPEDSQYSVASFIQDFIDTKVAKLHPRLKQYLKDNDNSGMKIL